MAGHEHIPVPTVLDGARDYDEVLVIGWQDGEIVAGSSTGRTSEILEMIETLKFKLLRGDFFE